MDVTMLVVGSAIVGIFVGGILVWYSLKKKQEKYAFKVVKDAQEESQNILKQAKVEAITDENGEIFAQLALPKLQQRWVKTTDGKQELGWIILPPHFDATKKYPTL